MLGLRAMRPCNLMLSSTASNIFPPTSSVHTFRPWISLAPRQPNLDKNKNQIQKKKKTNQQFQYNRKEAHLYVEF